MAKFEASWEAKLDTRDQRERIFHNSVNVEMAEDLVSQGFRPVLLRINPLDTEQKMHVLLREPDSDKELVVVKRDRNMSPFMLTIDQFAEWIGYNAQEVTVEIPITDNITLQQSTSHAAQVFREGQSIEE